MEEETMKRAIQKSTMADTIGLLEAFEEFIEEKEAQNKSPKTIHNYRQTLGQRIDSNFF